MEAAGFEVSVYPLRDDCGSPADAAALRDWLSSLPKPAAVLAAADWRAVQVFDACQAAGFRIPNQVSLLGVDNNDFDCLGITPQLSSVQPDYEGSGFRAAAELEALMSSTRPEPPRHIYLPARTVVGRGSTKPIPPASVLVRRGLSFIRAHACEGLRVDDVAGDETQVSVNYADLNKDLSVGDRVLINNGLIAMDVERIEGPMIR